MLRDINMAHLRDSRTSASSTEIPTINFTQTLERSSSHPDPADDAPEQYDRRESDYQVKATLTDVLNDGRVKSSPHSSRRVQNVLMDTERELRKHRRQSRRSSERLSSFKG